MSAILFHDATAKTFAGTETVSIVPTPGLCRHQIDIGTATTGSYAVNVDFFTGQRTIATIDLTEADRLPFAFEGVVKSIQLVPTGVGGNSDISYVAVNQG